MALLLKKLFVCCDERIIFLLLQQGMLKEIHIEMCIRDRRREKRDPKEIGISAVRGGSIVGEHEVLFCGQDEVCLLYTSRCV